MPRVLLGFVAFAVGAAACGGSDDGDTAVAPQVTAASPATNAVPTTPAATNPPTTAVNLSTTEAATAPEPTTAAPPTTQPPPTTTTFVDGEVITIGDLFFRPSSLSLTVGDTVVWHHEGDFPHTTTAGTPSARSDLWHSGTLSTGDTFAVTFDTAGTFQYFCSIHPNDMQATITVTDG